MADTTQAVEDLTPAISGAAKFINDTTAIGKSGKVTIWSAASLIVVAALTAIVANPMVFAALHWGILVVIANVLLVFFKNLFDGSTKNF